jgi:hypothetical protein
MLILIPFFFYTKTEKIISHLTDAGFIDMAKQLHNVVCTIGRLRPYDSFSKKGKIYDAVWRDFEKMAIPKDFKILFKYQLIVKSMHIFSLIYFLLFLSLPVFVLFYTLVRRLLILGN